MTKLSQQDSATKICCCVLCHFFYAILFLQIYKNETKYSVPTAYFSVWIFPKDTEAFRQHVRTLSDHSSASPPQNSVQTKMAAEGVVRWSTVVGEYGVLLTDMGSMEDLRTPIKSYPRIKVCVPGSIFVLIAIVMYTIITIKQLIEIS